MRLAGGEIRVHQGQLASARFTIDMTSIASEDLADPALNALLLAHLRTADFFDTEHHPTAEFVADAAEPIDPCTDGTPNYLLRGTFTLRGISHPLEFPVLIAAKDDARHLTGQGVLASTAPPTAATTAPANSSASSAPTSSTTTSISTSKSMRSGRVGTLYEVPRYHSGHQRRNTGSSSRI